MSENYWPLRIFISSVMQDSTKPERDVVVDIRLRLYKVLDSYSFLSPYKLEDENPSVMPLTSTYLSRLRNTDLVIFVLDSRFPVPDGVRKEITTSRQEKIPRDYFILPGAAGEGEVMKQKLIQEGETNFLSVLPESENYVSLIEKDILSQLVSVFQAFSNRSLVPIDDSLPEKNSQAFTTVATSAQFGTEMFNKIGLSKQFMRQLIFHWEPDTENKITHPQSGIDQIIVDMIHRLIDNTPLPFSWETTVLEAIKVGNEESPLTEQLMAVIKQRLKAVTLFFSGNNDQAYECLQQVLKMPEINEVPTWILQDVLIDLRNLLNLQDEFNNRGQINNEYQIRLNNSTSPFQYPVIDHALKEVQGWVLEEQNNFKTAPSDEESMYGSGISIYADVLTEAEILACCNGSITQIRQLPNHLNIISKLFLQHFERRVYLLDVIRNQLLMGKSYKKINRWLTRYSFLYGQFTDDDAMAVLKSVQSYPTRIERLSIIATTLRIFGDYLSDSHFKQSWAKLFTEIQNWQQEKTLILYPATEILGLFRNLYRIPQDDVISFVSSFSKRASRYNDSLADIIFGAVDHENSTLSQRKKVTTALLQIIKSNGERIFTQKIENAIFSTLISWPDESTEISTILKQNRPDYYTDKILPYLWKDTSEPGFTLFIEKQISLMSSQNAKQTAVSTSMFATDPFANIYNAISHGYLPDSSYLNQILQEIANTVNNPYQTTNTKLSAVDLMISLMDSAAQWSKFAQQIDTGNLTARSMSFSDISTPTQQIEALRNFIEITRSSKDNGSLLLTLTLSQSAQYLYFISKLIVSFLPVALQNESLSSTVPQILQFIIVNNDPHHRENKLLSKIAQCLLILNSDKRYSDISIGQLQRLVSDTNTVVQRELVSQIHALPTDQQTPLKSIKTQLLNNPSYSVRDLANRDFI